MTEVHSFAEAADHLRWPGSVETTELRVTIPVRQAGRLLQEASRCWDDEWRQLHRDDDVAEPAAKSPAQRPESARDLEGDVSPEALRLAEPGLTTEAVTAAYRGGSSDTWRPFLMLLARQPGTWVSWSYLHATLGLTSRQCAGMIGAAERRCKGNPPYIKSYDDGHYWFQMPASAAEIVIRLAETAGPTA